MPDTKNQVVIYPKCRRPEVHFSCQTGFYCRACGRTFSSEEAKVFVEHEVFKMKSDDCL